MTRRIADNDEFTRMWTAGVPTADMAKHFGYSNKHSVSGRASAMGLTPRNDTEANKLRDRDIFNAYLGGMTGAQIAKAWGLSKSATSEIIRKMKARHPKRVDPAAADTRVLAWSASPAAIAKALAKHQGARA